MQNGTDASASVRNRIPSELRFRALLDEGALELEVVLA